MSVNSPEELLRAMSEGNFEAIIGTPECFWFEIKQSRYQTIATNDKKLSEYGKYELCKDVAALANNKGGILLLGVKEKLSPTEGKSVADEITPIQVISIDLQNYKQALMALVYPLLKDIEFKWYLVDSKQGILAISVPKSESSIHILRQSIDESGKRLRGLEIPVRSDDQTYLHTAESLSELINKKISLNSFSQISLDRHTRLLKRIEINNRIDMSYKESRARSKKIRQQLTETMNWEDEGYILIQCSPLSTKSRLDGFYDTIRNSFANTKPVRSGGFNLNSFGRDTDTVDGAMLKSGTKNAAIRLDTNGTLTLIAQANHDYLAWAMAQYETDDSLLINSIVLVETCFEFVRFIYENLLPFGMKNWEYVLEMKNMKKTNAILYPGRPGWLHADQNMAISDDYTAAVDRKISLEKDTFRLLEEIYAGFALPPQSIPFSDNNEITKEMIRSISVDGR